jgi:CRP-like cAMP-binding protein
MTIGFDNGGGHGAEVRMILETGLANLQDWLEIRLLRQEDLLVQLQEALSAGDPKMRSIASLTNEAREVLAGHVPASSRSGSALPCDMLLPSFPADLPAPCFPRQAPSDVPRPVMPAEPVACMPYAGGGKPAEPVATLPGELGEPSLRAAWSDDTPQNPRRQNSPQSFLSKHASNRTGGSDHQDWQMKLMEIFDQLDLDKSGSLDRSEIVEACEELGLHEVQGTELFKKIDKSQNGSIDRVEWLHLIEEATQCDKKDVDLFVRFVERLAQRQMQTGQIYKDNRMRVPAGILRHDHPVRVVWDLLVMVLLLWIAVTMPLTMGFGPDDTIEQIDNILNWFFCVDVVLNFRTTYTDRDDAIVLDGQRIAINYLKSWFLLDFCSSMPFELITAGLLPNLTPARLLKLGKIAKVLKILRMSKMVKVIQCGDLMEMWEEQSTSKIHQTMGKLFVVLLVLVMLCHWMACLMGFVERSFVKAGEGSLEKYLGPNSSKGSKYIAAMYWAMTTLSTVGYGDITPTSDAERFYSMIAMVVGGAFYGYIIGCVTSAISDTDLNTRAYYERMGLVVSWLNVHDDIPKVLRRKIRAHFKETLSSKTAIHDSEVICDLSPELRADAAFFLLHEQVRLNPMFIELPNSALANVVEIIKRVTAKADERVVSCGDPGIAMYVLVEGQSRIDFGSLWMPAGTAESPENKKNADCESPKSGQSIESTKKVELNAGQSFGEEIIFGLEESYQYTVITNHPSIFCTISEDAFKDRFRNMPDLHKIMLNCFIRSRSEPASKSVFLKDSDRNEDADEKLQFSRRGGRSETILTHT